MEFSNKRSTPEADVEKVEDDDEDDEEEQRPQRRRQSGRDDRGEEKSTDRAPSRAESADNQQPEKLDDKEKKVVAQVTAEAELEQLPDTEGETSPEMLPTLAAEAYWEEVAEHGNGDLALANVANKLGVSLEATAEVPEEGVAELVDEAIETEPEVTEELEEPESEPDEEIVFERTKAASPPETEEDAPEEDEDGTTATATAAAVGSGGSATPPPMPPPTASGSTGGGGSGRPPMHMLHAMHPVTPGLPPTFVTSGNLNTAPASSGHEAIYDSGNPAVTALTGGIIGYLIGRRRGRIKAEKKLIPIQKKLSAEVVDLQWQLKAKETKIRQLAAEQVQVQGQVIIERLAQPDKRRQARREARRATAEKLTAARLRAPEAHHLHGETKSRERIGHMLINAESLPARVAPLIESLAKAPVPVEIKSDALPIAEKQLHESVKHQPKHMETLSRAELLTLSEKVSVNGTTLRQIYETHLIGERGLRRLVAEHLRGGDLKKALRREIVDREIDFERDPGLRDMGAVDLQATGGSAPASNPAALNKLLERAEASMPAMNVNEEAAFYKARANYQAEEHKKQRQQQILMDVSLAAVVIILIVAAIVTYLSRH